MSNDPATDRTRLANRIRIVGFCVAVPTLALSIALLVMNLRGQPGRAAWPWTDIMFIGLAVTIALGFWQQSVRERGSVAPSVPGRVVVIVVIVLMLGVAVAGLVWH